IARCIAHVEPGCTLAGADERVHIQSGIILSIGPNQGTRTHHKHAQHKNNVPPVNLIDYRGFTSIAEYSRLVTAIHPRSGTGRPSTGASSTFCDNVYCHASMMPGGNV